MIKKFEINAYGTEAAKEQATKMGINVKRNATQAWKNNNSPTSNNDLKLFAVEMLEKYKLENNGDGIIIAVDPGTKDTRERPYSFVNNVVTGKKEKVRVFEVRTVEHNTLICETLTKDEAIRKAKEAMSLYKEDMVCRVHYKVVNGKDVAFELKYKPSANAKEGKYIVFANVDE